MSGRKSLLQQVLDSSSSDDDDDFFIQSASIIHTYYTSMSAPKQGGSVPGHKIVRRKRQEGHQKLYEDYFSDDPTYGPEFFRRRFVLCHVYFLI